MVNYNKQIPRFLFLVKCNSFDILCDWTHVLMTLYYLFPLLKHSSCRLLLYKGSLIMAMPLYDQSPIQQAFMGRSSWPELKTVHASICLRDVQKVLSKTHLKR